MARRARRLLGRIGLPGGGFGLGYGFTATSATPRRRRARCRRLPQGTNPVDGYIPVARISDMLLHPGDRFDYDGGALHLPRHPPRLLGGRQPLPPPPGPRPAAPRLAPARHGRRPRAATGPPRPPRRHRPARDHDPRARRHRRPPAATRPRSRCTASPSRSARRATTTRSSPRWPRELGMRPEFTEGRDEMAGCAHLYEADAARGRRRGLRAADVRRVLGRGRARATRGPSDRTSCRRVPRRPRGAPLPTPSGRIELFSETSPASATTTARAIRPGCAGGVAWRRARGALSRCMLVAKQPANRLHSQLDPGSFSLAQGPGREPIRMHPEDAAARGVATATSCAFFNDRGALPRRRRRQRRGHGRASSNCHRRLVRPLRRPTAA